MAKLPTAIEVYGARQAPRGDNRVLGYSGATALAEAAEFSGKALEGVGDNLGKTIKIAELSKKKADKEYEAKLAVAQARQDKLTTSRALSELSSRQIGLETDFLNRDDYHNFNDEAKGVFDEISAKYKDSFITPEGRDNWNQSLISVSERENFKLSKLVKSKNDAALLDDANLRLAENNDLLSKTSDLDKQADIVQSSMDSIDVLRGENLITSVDAFKKKQAIQKSYAYAWLNQSDTGDALNILNNVEDKGDLTSKVSKVSDVDTDSMIKFIMNLEGGYLSSEPDGATAIYGINSKANEGVDLAKLKEEDAFNIYKTKYIRRAKLGTIPDNMKMVVFDAVVNGFDPKVLGFSIFDAVKRADGDVNKLVDIRREYYDTLVKNNPDKYKKYHSGWINRLDTISNSNFVRGRVDTGTPLDFLGVTEIKKLKPIIEAKLVDDVSKLTLDELSTNIRIGEYNDLPEGLQSKVNKVFKGKVEAAAVDERIGAFSQLTDLYKLGEGGEATWGDFTKLINDFPEDSPRRELAVRMRDFYTNPDGTAKAAKKLVNEQVKLEAETNLNSMYQNIGFKLDKKTGKFLYQKDTDVMDNLVNYANEVHKAVASGAVTASGASKRLALVDNAMQELVDWSSAESGTFGLGGDRKRLSKVFRRSPFATGYETINNLIKTNPSLGGVKMKSDLFAAVNEVTPELSQLYKEGKLPPQQVPRAFSEAVLKKIIPALNDLEAFPDVVRLSDGTTINLPPSVVSNNFGGDRGNSDFILKESYNATDGSAVTKSDILKMATDAGVTPRVVVANLVANGMIGLD